MHSLDTVFHYFTTIITITVQLPRHRMNATLLTNFYQTNSIMASFHRDLVLNEASASLPLYD